MTNYENATVLFKYFMSKEIMKDLTILKLLEIYFALLLLI